MTWSGIQLQIQTHKLPHIGLIRNVNIRFILALVKAILNMHSLEIYPVMIIEICSKQIKFLGLFFSLLTQ